MADSDQEKTEEASSKRRSEFREKGQVAQSKEVHTAALLGFSVLLWVYYAPVLWGKGTELFAFLLSPAGMQEVTVLSVVDLAWKLAGKMAILLGPLFLLTLVVGFFSSFLQVGPLFTTKPLAPDFSKLNPISGMGRFISLHSAVELIKSLLKVTFVGVVAYRTVRGEFDRALTLPWMELSDTVRFLGHTAYLVLLKTSGILVVLALVDYLYTRWEMEKKMRMTKQELKEEFKESDGDPHVKGRIRSLQMRMARKRMLADVPKADVVITNPTHLSVALSYVKGEMGAPRVVAKGADHLALKIREIAAEHGVPRVENVPVARALYQVEVGQEIPEEMFRAVAEILAYVYGLKAKGGRG